MDIERKLGDTAHGFHDQGSDRDVGDKMPIHHIDVDVVRPCPFNRLHFFSQSGEIRRQDGGCNLSHIGIPFIF